LLSRIARSTKKPSIGKSDTAARSLWASRHHHDALVVAGIDHATP